MTKSIINTTFFFLLTLLTFACEDELLDPTGGEEGGPALVTDIRNNESFDAFSKNQAVEHVDSMLYSIDPRVLRSETMQQDNLVCVVDVMAASAENQDFLLNHLDDMFLGGIYRYESLFNGGFRPVNGGKLAPQDFGVAGLPVDRVSYHIEEPGVVPYLETINDLRQQTGYAAADAQIDFRVIDVHSMEQLSMQLGAKLKIGLWGKISASIETNRLEELSYFVIEMKQKHFSINLEIPGTPSEMYAELPATEELGSWSPVICSSITYGRAAYFIVSSSESRETAKLAIDATFKAFSSNLDVTVDRQHEAVANEFRIDGLVYGGAQEPALQSISGIPAIRDYMTSGFKDENAFGVPLAFKFRFLRDFSVAKTVSSVEYPIRSSCETIPEERDVVISRDAEVLTSIGTLFPVQVNGDRDFGGDGPNVWSETSLCLSEDKTKIDIKIDVIYEESDATGNGGGDNNTRGEIHFRKTIYTAEEGYFIDEIYTSVTDSYHYLDFSHAVHFSPTFVDGLIYRYINNGDTSGHDIEAAGVASESNKNSHSYWEAEFNDIRLRIKEQE